jgi:hypothetical protein
MDISIIPLSQLQTDTENVLNGCFETGRPVVVELPDHRFVTIQSLEPDDDDSLIDDLIERNQSFQSLLEKSATSPRKDLTSTRANGEK